MKRVGLEPLAPKMGWMNVAADAFFGRLGWEEESQHRRYCAGLQRSSTRSSRRGRFLHSGLSLLELGISCKSRSGPRKDGGSQREDASKGESVGSIGSASLFTILDSRKLVSSLVFFSDRRSISPCFAKAGVDGS